MAVESALPILKEALQVPGLLKEIYGDALKPGVSQVGKALGTVLGLGNTILLPIYLLNERTKLIVEKNLEQYRESLKDVPEAEIGNPTIYEKLEAPLRQQADGTEWYKTKPDDWKLDFRKGKIEIAPFGDMFLEACLKKLQDK